MTAVIGRAAIWPTGPDTSGPAGSVMPLPLVRCRLSRRPDTRPAIRRSHPRRARLTGAEHEARP
jgi:hypothetical protein